VLGTRLLFMGLESRPQVSGGGSGRVLAAANHSIPPLWLLAFSVEDLSLLPLEDGGHYPVLMTDRSQALQRLDQLQPLMASFIGEDGLRLLQNWSGYLRALPDQVVAIEPYELWISMAQPAQLEEQLRDQLMTLQTLERLPPAERLGRLQQADLHYGISDQISLCGYGWG